MSKPRKAPLASVQAPSPYVGPRPYEREETPTFKGRERESVELLSMVISSRVTLLYAPSGAGKTSLLNAGLIPALETEGFQVLPVARIRPLLVDHAPPTSAANVYAHGVLSSWGRVSPQTTITEFLAARERVTDSEGFSSARAIILDQFEELFTAYLDRWQQRQPFLSQLTDALRADPLLRIVLAIREDYLAQLDAYAPLLPGGLRARYRLDRLGREAALSAITGPLEQTGRRFASGVAEKLVDDLLTFRVDLGDGKSVEVPGEFVEPVQLQVVCQRLWAGLPPGATEITQEHLRTFGDVDEVLAQLYADAVRNAAARSRVREARVRHWVEQSLITPGGTRGTVYRAASATAELPNEAVDELERCRLVRAEWRAGARWYELTHDRLIGPVQSSNASYFTAAADRNRRRIISASVVLPVVVAAVAVPVLLALKPSPTNAKRLADQLALVQNLRRYPANPNVFGGLGDQAMFGIAFTGAGSEIAAGVSRLNGERIATIWRYDDRAWARIGSVAPAGMFNAVAAAGGRVVAVGTAGPVGQPGRPDEDATVWTLVNGQWIHSCGAACGDGVGGGGHHGQTMYGVVARRAGGFVAVGYDVSDANALFDAAVWTSPDGIHWSRTPSAAALSEPGRNTSQVMKAVTETPSGLIVAVGRDGAEAAVWTSRDGRSWTRIRSPALTESDAAGAPTATLELNDIVSSGSLLVAVGRRGDTTGNRNEAAVWLSDDDAQSWRRVQSPVFERQGGGQSGGRGQQMRGVVAVPFGFVAVGVDHPSGPQGPATAQVWTSLDGTVWSPVSSPSFAGQGNYSLQAAAAIGDQVVAVGDAPAPYRSKSDKQDAAVWSTLQKGT
jgi:Novel STAND NTPase 1